MPIGCNRLITLVFYCNWQNVKDTFESVHLGSDQIEWANSSAGTLNAAILCYVLILVRLNGHSLQFVTASIYRLKA